MINLKNSKNGIPAEYGAINAYSFVEPLGLRLEFHPLPVKKLTIEKLKQLV